jgi:hypothetical protein
VWKDVVAEVDEDLIAEVVADLGLASTRHRTRSIAYGLVDQLPPSLVEADPEIWGMV